MPSQPTAETNTSGTAPQANAELESVAAPSEVQHEESTQALNPYSKAAHREALEKLLPPSDEPIEKRLADHRERKFNSYLEHAALSTVDETSGPAADISADAITEPSNNGEQASPALEANAENTEPDRSAVNPYQKLKSSGAAKAPGKEAPSPEKQAAESERRAQRFASYVKNASRSN